jgi:hypothetical protein
MPSQQLPAHRLRLPCGPSNDDGYCLSVQYFTDPGATCVEASYLIIEGLSTDHSVALETVVDVTVTAPFSPASKIDQYSSRGEEHTKIWPRFQIRVRILLDNSLSAKNYLIP